eukprot:7595664-Pyramimonas_sp.AAC.1
MDRCVPSTGDGNFDYVRTALRAAHKGNQRFHCRPYHHEHHEGYPARSVRDAPNTAEYECHCDECR